MRKKVEEYLMKVKRLLLFPVLCGMFLSSCGESAPAKKATINIETNQYMTTTLKAGEYELNKAIEFTVSPINEEYSVSSVKMNEVELPPSNSNKYTFTPTEEKTYTLKVTTNKLENKVVYTFEGLTEENYTQKLTKGGTRVVVEPYVAEAGFENVFKNKNLNVANDKQFQLICRTKSEDKDVWIRKIEFTFVGDKNQLALINGDEFESYANGVWTTTLTKGNLGQNSIDFKGINEAVISKIVITTAPYVAEKTKLVFNGLDADDKVYSFDGFTYEEWQKRKLVSSDTELVTLQTYYLYVEFSQYHAEYYSVLNMKFGNTTIEDRKLFDPEGKEIVVYRMLLSDKDVIDGKVTINATWTPKIANEHFVIDTVSANKYVKGFMETEPKASLYLENAIGFGNKVSINLRPKRGYKNLKMIVNGQTIEREEEKDLYTFTVPFAKPINISFTAEEGDRETEGKEVIELTGTNKEKGKLLAAELEGAIYVTFYANEDHPTATLTAISFEGSPLTPFTPPDGEEEPESKIYKLNSEQTAKYKATADKSSLFVVTIQEQDSYKSTVRINKGAFKVEIEGKQATEDMGYDVYEVDGKSSVTVKFILNEYKNLHSIEVNDKRLTESEYKVNLDGSISYTFAANAKTYDFIVQTKAQKVTLSLDETSTTGYIIKDLPKEFEVGQKVRLSLGVTDESKYWLEGKVVTVTYNGEKLTVDESNFTFEILPLKGISKIKVEVSDKPQA